MTEVPTMPISINQRFKLVRNLLETLSHQFGVAKPALVFKKMEYLHGFYKLDEITLNKNTVRNNLSVAVKTLRHEFSHYLQDLYSLPESKSELKARRFEDDLLALGLLPKSQTKLRPE